jgi:ATP-binding cassette subfamily C protein
MQPSDATSDSSLKNAFRVLHKHGLWRQIPILVGLLANGLLDGISLTTLLPIISMISGDAGFKSGRLQAYLQGVFDSLHIPLNLGFLCLLIILAVCLKAVISLQINRYVGNVVAEIASDLRRTIINRLLDARWSYFTVNPIGRFVAAILSEANWAGAAYRSALSVASMMIRALVLACVALVFGWQTAAVAVTLGILMGLALRVLAITSRRAAKKFRTALSALISDLMDLIVGYKPLKAMGREGTLIKSLRRETGKIKEAMFDLVMMQQLSNALPDLLIVCTIALGIYIVNLYFGIAIEPSIAFGVATYGLMNSVARVQKATQELAQSDTMYWAIMRLIDEIEGAAEPHRGEAAPSLNATIELRGVNFSYGRGKVLDNVSISIPAGRITTLVGESGSGKTTVADLILGLYQPDSGDIRVDGVGLDKIDMYAWRSLIGYVPQEVLMFNDTIEANITLGDPALSRDDVLRALHMAGLLDFVESLPTGLETLVGERGMMISGGQRQRLALARALVHRPRLLILDEATSALDPQTEAEICAAVQRQAGEMTILAITHQKSWVDAADRVYLIDRGVAELSMASRSVTAEMTPAAESRATGQA